MARIMTTLGPRRADELGTLLPHEHVFVDLRTWDQPGYAEADPAEVIALVGPDIEAAVSAATRFPLVVPTGIYREPWVPAWAQRRARTPSTNGCSASSATR